MPRDDLSIDFVKRMPQGGEALDPALILDDWINRVANLPEEIRFLQDEIADKDRQYNDCIRIIEERDGRIQKFIKTHGSHEHNPREEACRKAIVENFKKAETLADEKIALSQKMKAIVDRHTRQLDMQIKQLYDRGEPGFTDPDELPSLLRQSAANKTAAASARASAAASSALPSAVVSDMIKSATKAAAGSSAAGGGGVGSTVIAVGGGRGAGNAQSRQAQAQQGHSSSAPASPAASMILNRQARESSAGPGTAPGKGGRRAGSSLANNPPTSSGLARHSSLGPGTPKSQSGAGGVQRAGSAGPRAIAKGAGAGPGRKGSTPAASGPAAAASGPEKNGPGRKKGNAGTNTPTTKTSLSRVKRPAKASAASSGDESELSDASSTDDSDDSSRHATPTRGSSQGGSGSGSGSGGNGNGGSGNGNGAGNKDGSSSQPVVKREKDNSNGISSSVGTSTGAGGHSGPGNGPGGPGRGGVNKHRAGDKPGGRGVAKGAPSSDDRMDLDDEEAGDDSKYCLCQNVSFGDMVACDNEDCPFEWFHWSCVGLKSEPNGTWYCPVCTEKKNKDKDGKDSKDTKDGKDSKDTKDKSGAGGDGRIVVGSGSSNAARSGSGPKSEAGVGGSNGSASGGASGASASAGNTASTPTSEGSGADRATPAATKKGK